jgi:metal-responsive CopG/Arc/MetJ family transcriptional regulator
MTGYTEVVKTAVSIPDELFEEAEKAARASGISRSRLYSEALRRYLASRTSGDITARINAVCAEVDTGLEEGWARMQSEVLARDEG